MNYYHPAQIEKGPNAGKWHYVRANKRTGTHPVGYCADGCPGHQTDAEAREHYRQYELDNLAFHNPPESPKVAYRCQAEPCAEMTAGRASMGPGLLVSWHLCDEHRNRETVEQLCPEIGDFSASY